MKLSNIINAIILLLFACSKTFCAENIQNPAPSSLLSRFVAACCCCSVNERMVVNPSTPTEFRETEGTDPVDTPRYYNTRSVLPTTNYNIPGYKLVRAIEIVTVLEFTPNSNTNINDFDIMSQDETRDGDDPSETIINAQKTLLKAGTIIQHLGAQGTTAQRIQIRPGRDDQASKRWNGIISRIKESKEQSVNIQLFLEKLPLFPQVHISDDNMQRLENLLAARRLNDIELNFEEKSSEGSEETQVVVRNSPKKARK